MARTQVRLALVIEGGVSLAVWMSGMVQEIDVLRRAGSPDRQRPPADGYDDGGFGLWQELCDRLDVDVVVDVVAGTSAGGLNGTLLACAAAAGQPLPPLKNLWLTEAQLCRGRLLHKEGQSALPSLLDGDYFEQALLRAVTRAIGSGPQGESSQPVTLLTTATALGEQLTSWQDSTGQRFEVADHRRVYRFRNDPRHLVYTPPEGPTPHEESDMFTVGAVCDIVPAHARTLAHAARATASFPGAFAPVPESADGCDLARYEIQGPSRSGTTDGPTVPTFLTDGGILDNAPFEPLLAEFTRREVESDWRRVIGYVVANDALATSMVPAANGASAPTGEPPSTRRSKLALGWFPVLTSALRMPSEISFRQGVEALVQHSVDAERLLATPEDLLRRVLDGQLVDVALLEGMYPHYRRSRLASGVVTAYLFQSGRASVRDVRLPRFDTTSVELGADSAWVPGPDLKAVLAAPDFRWGTAVADRSIRLLLRHVQSLAAPEDTATRRKAIDHALGIVSSTASKVAAVRTTVEERIAAAPATQDPIALAGIVEQAADGTRCPTVLQRLLLTATETAGALDGRPGPDLLRALLTVEILTQAMNGPVPFTRAARFDLVRMGPDVDNPLVPGVPGDADGARRPPGEWKLYGTQLAHFGAFGDERWRANDFTWGRLDGAAHLVRLLTEAVGGTPALPPQDVDAFLRRISETVLAEERMSADDLQQSLHQLATLDSRGALNAIRATPTGQDVTVATISDLLRLLRADGDGIPAGAHLAGTWLSATLSRRATSSPRLPVLQRAARTLTTPWPRPRFWAWVRRPHLPHLDGH